MTVVCRMILWTNHALLKQVVKELSPDTRNFIVESEHVGDNVFDHENVEHRLIMFIMCQNMLPWLHLLIGTTPCHY